MKNTDKIICYVRPPKQYRDSDDMWLDGYVLRAEGPSVEGHHEDQGDCLGDWVFDCLTPQGYTGIAVWEGIDLNAWRLDLGGEYEPCFSGVWRPATAAELWQLRQGWTEPANTESGQ